MYGELEGALCTIQHGSIVVLAKTGEMSDGGMEQLPEHEELLLKELFDSNVSLGLGDLSNTRDVWNLMVDTANPSNFQVRFGLVEDAIQDEDEDSEPGVQTEVVEFVANNIMYTVQTSNKINVGGWKGSIAVHISTRPSDHRMNTITLEDDAEAGSWNVGDSVVIASTDFNFKQAERFTITSVDGNSVTVEGDLNYVHFGQKYEGLDMRAEVGMLSRNIKARCM